MNSEQNIQSRPVRNAKKVWTANEDILLNQLIEQSGIGNWNTIASNFVERTGKQCRERYHNHLQPNIKKGSWSKEEDNLIVHWQLQIGNQWARITNYLPGRSDNAVKNRWHAIERSRRGAVAPQVNFIPQDLSIPELSDDLSENLDDDTFAILSEIFGDDSGSSSHTDYMCGYQSDQLSGYHSDYSDLSSLSPRDAKEISISFPVTTKRKLATFTVEVAAPPLSLLRENSTDLSSTGEINSYYGNYRCVTPPLLALVFEQDACRRSKKICA